MRFTETYLGPILTRQWSFAFKKKCDVNRISSVEIEEDITLINLSGFTEPYFNFPLAEEGAVRVRVCHLHKTPLAVIP